jgi:hypothetical protein
MTPEKQPFRKQWYSRGGPGKPFKIAGFDTETLGLGGRVLYGTTMVEGFDHADGFRGRNIIGDMFTVMCDFPDHIWFAHNAQYDWRYFLRYFRDQKFRVNFSLRNDSSIFALRVFIDRDCDPSQSRTLRMRDSYAIWPHTLRQLADAFCPEFPKGEIDFERETFDPNKRAHVDYAKRDVEILVRGLRRYDDIIKEKYDVHLSGTVASTAMRAWQRLLDKQDYFHNPKRHEDFIRSGYFGGLVFLTRNDKIGRAYTYDINSSYPYQMRKHGVPYGSICSTRFFRTDLPGLYDVTIGTPDDLRVPIIPKRNVRGKFSQVLWPRGVFRTTVTSIELEFALKHGYRLFEVHKGICWEKIIFPFDDFVTHAEIIRKSFKGRTEETVAKLIQNSLYGKFGTRRERLNMFSLREIDQDDNGEYLLDGYQPWDDEGEYYIKREYNEDMLCLPQWSVWITANARVHLLREVYETLGVDNVIYGDTDSITTTSQMKTGNDYGDFKLEKTWQKFRAIAPKVYAGQLDGDHGRLDPVTGLWRGLGPDGTWKGAAKGIPSRKAGNELFREIYEKEIISVEISTLPSLLVTMKGGNEGLKQMTRRSTDIENSANWECWEDNSVRPKRAPG